MMEVDDFIDAHDTDKTVSWFLFLHRLPATLQFKFEKEIKKHKLFCDHEGERWRVTMASRFGDIGISRNLEKDMGYEKRVMLEDCSNWSGEPDGVFRK
jgi:hypothetical protein